MTELLDQSDLAALFRDAGCSGCAHVEAMDGSGSLSLDADAPVVSASTFKVFVALELFEQAAGGRVDLSDRVVVDPKHRTYGPTGLSCFGDPAEVSLRDLAYLMLAISDNAATDELIQRVGLKSINDRLAGLGLEHTKVPSDLRTMLNVIAGHVGFVTYDELAAAQAGELGADAYQRAMDLSLIPTCPVFDAETTIHTTAREMARWLAMVWHDDAASVEACAQVRSLMALEIGHRWAEVFGPSAVISAKGGSLAGFVRNQVGVVEFPEGDAYAVAIFTRADEPFSHTTEIWRAIREAAAKAVSELRSN